MFYNKRHFSIKISKLFYFILIIIFIYTYMYIMSNMFGQSRIVECELLTELPERKILLGSV